MELQDWLGMGVLMSSGSKDLTAEQQTCLSLTPVLCPSTVIIRLLPLLLHLLQGPQYNKENQVEVTNHLLKLYILKKS